jgi:hypothetical protein
VTDQVSHPYKTTGKIIVLYTLIFVFLDSSLIVSVTGLKNCVVCVKMCDQVTRGERRVRMAVKSLLVKISAKKVDELTAKLKKGIPGQALRAAGG